MVFDQIASLDGNEKPVCKSALFHLRNIVKIREYLTVERTKSLVHAFVTCILDNCNSLLIGFDSEVAAHQELCRTSGDRALKVWSCNSHSEGAALASH